MSVPLPSRCGFACQVDLTAIVLRLHIEEKMNARLERQEREQIGLKRGNGKSSSWYCWETEVGHVVWTVGQFCWTFASHTSFLGQNMGVQDRRTNLQGLLLEGDWTKWGAMEVINKGWNQIKPWNNEPWCFLRLCKWNSMRRTVCQLS